MLSDGNSPRLEVEVVDLDACAAEVSWKADQPQPTASVVKLLIALDRHDRSGVPEDSDADAVRAMLSASDDRVASRLWQQLGGPVLVRRQAGKLGLAHTSPPDDPGQWGSTDFGIPRAFPGAAWAVKQGWAFPTAGGCSTRPAWSGPGPGRSPSRS